MTQSIEAMKSKLENAKKARWSNVGVLPNGVTRSSRFYRDLYRWPQACRAEGRQLCLLAFSCLSDAAGTSRD